MNPLQKVRGLVSKGGRVLRTLSYLQPAQVAWWGWRRLRGFEPPRQLSPEPRNPDFQLRDKGIARHCWDGQSHSFVNHSRKWDGDWFPKDTPSRLWDFHLHYHDWLRQPSLGNEEGLRWIRDWINKVEGGDPWGPYPSSLRIYNWVRFLLSRQLQADDIEASLYSQADCLSRNLETHLLANHLWANAKALLVAGMFFEGERASRWEQTGRQLVSEQLDIQFLSDGGHIERSPMYHVILLEDILDLLALLPKGDSLTPLLRDVAGRALEFLAGILLPDGRLPLLGDTAWGQAPRAQQIFAYAQRLGFSVEDLPHTGMYVAQDSGIARLQVGDWCLVARAGDIGVDWQPGHTHADAGSFELSWKKNRIVVDTGCGTYVPGKDRTYMRSTAAHNTLVLDGQNSAEVWAAHRLGRRGHSKNLSWDSVDDQQTLSFWYDGYAHLPGNPMHRREWCLDESGLRITDKIDGCETHLLQSFLHLPTLDVKFSETDDSNVSRAEFVCEKDEFEVEANTGNLHHWESHWWPYFRRKFPATTLCWNLGETQLPVTLETRIRKKAD